MLVDGAGELIVDILTANRSLSGIPSASAILDTSNYTFQAISYGKDADGFRQHAHSVLNTVNEILPSKKSVILFGGTTSSAIWKNTTWEMSSTNFSSISPTGVPDARNNHAMSFDSTRGRVVLFGGWSSSGSLLGDTWELSGNINSNIWTKLSTGGPSPREKPGMAFFSGGPYTLLFGGQVSRTSTRFVDFSNETWKWNGASWTKLFPNTTPTYRAGHAMVFDEARNKIVMFGGYNYGYLGDTWEWDGSDWSLVATTGPGARAYHTMVYDSVNQVTLLYGGIYAAGNKADVWKWNGTTWTNITPTDPGGPLYRYGHSMAYFKDRNVSIVFGGLDQNLRSSNELWEFHNTASPFWYLRSTSGLSGLYQAAMVYYDNKTTTPVMTPNDGVIKVLSYDAVSVSSYHTSSTASALQDTYKLLPQSPTPLDKRLELKSTLPNYSTGVPDVGQCLNSIINTSLSANGHLIGCFPSSGTTYYWMVSSTFNPSANVIFSGSLSSFYNTYSLMDYSGFLTFAQGDVAYHNALYTGVDYTKGAIRPCSSTLSFPNKITVIWKLGNGDAGALLLFGGLYHIGLWSLDLKEMLKQGYYPPYSFNALNNIRKYKLFAKKTFNKDLLYLNDSGGLSAFKTLFDKTGAAPQDIVVTWEIQCV